MSDEIILLDYLRPWQLKKIEVDPTTLKKLPEALHDEIFKGKKVLLKDNPVTSAFKKLKYDGAYLEKFEPNPQVDFSTPLNEAIYSHARLRCKRIGYPFTQDRTQPLVEPIRRSPEPWVRDEPDYKWFVKIRNEFGFIDLLDSIPIKVTGPDGKFEATCTATDISIPTDYWRKNQTLSLELYPDHPYKKRKETHLTKAANLIDPGRLILQSRPEFYLKLKAHRALIVSPSLTTPALVPEGKVLSLILAVTEDMHQAIDGERHAQTDAIGPMSLRRFYSQLAIQPYKKVDKTQVEYQGHKLYQTWSDAENSMHCTYLGALKNLSCEAEKAKDSVKGPARASNEADGFDHLEKGYEIRGQGWTTFGITRSSCENTLSKKGHKLYQTWSDAENSMHCTYLGALKNLSCEAEKAKDSVKGPARASNEADGFDHLEKGYEIRGQGWTTFGITRSSCENTLSKKRL